MRPLGDVTIVIPSGTTARIRQAHAFVLHLWGELIEGRLTNRKIP